MTSGCIASSWARPESSPARSLSLPARGFVGTLVDLCVVLGALAVLDVLFRGLSLSMAARLAESRRLSVSDVLTGILNRRGLTAAVPDLVATAEGLGTCVGVLLVDIDRFKEINDRFGHGQGDLVLQRVCRSIAGCLPDGALLARTGGEEMVVVVAGPADPVATAIRQAVAAASLDPAVTVSIGFVEAAPADCRPVRRLWDLVAAADRGLYAAKSQGRDCIRRGSVTDRIHPERIASDRREADRLEADRLEADGHEPRTGRPRPGARHPVRLGVAGLQPGGGAGDRRRPGTSTDRADDHHAVVGRVRRAGSRRRPADTATADPARRARGDDRGDRRVDRHRHRHRGEPPLPAAGAAHRGDSRRRRSALPGSLVQRRAPAGDDRAVRDRRLPGRDRRAQLADWRAR